MKSVKKLLNTLFRATFLKWHLVYTRKYTEAYLIEHNRFFKRCKGMKTNLCALIQRK